jgi:hypothetical protein
MLRMEAATNVRTMEFIGKDDWDRPVYKCLENGNLWKDLSDGSTPDLYSSSNGEFDGEPCTPIKSELVVVFKTKYEESPYRFSYMLLDRLQGDCKYFLGNGNRAVSQLWAGTVEGQIEKMKELHDSFPEGHKPEWLTYEEILDYEKRMSEDQPPC